MNVIVAGDLCPSPRNYHLFHGDNAELILGRELYSEWTSADYRIINLETTLTDFDTPIYKRGPALRAPTSAITGIKALNPQLVCTANNHIFDHGESGYLSTIKLLDEYGIPYVGSGENLRQSAIPYIIEGERRVGVYACADHEFTIAKERAPGANPYDPLSSFDHIFELKKRSDYVIVLYHGLKEYYRYPTPYTRRVCQKMADKGADVIILQHSHCIGCYEEYNGTVIVYGQGNFIFGDRTDEYTDNSLLIKLGLKEKLSVDYIPIIKTESTTRLASSYESEIIIKEFESRSEQILENGFIDNEFGTFCKDYYAYYSGNILRHPGWLIKLNQISGGKLIKFYRDRKLLLFLRNILTCDAHRELFLKILDSEIDKW